MRKSKVAENGMMAARHVARERDGYQTEVAGNARISRTERESSFRMPLADFAEPLTCLRSSAYRATIRFPDRAAVPSTKSCAMVVVGFLLLGCGSSDPVTALSIDGLLREATTSLVRKVRVCALRQPGNPQPRHFSVVGTGFDARVTDDGQRLEVPRVRLVGSTETGRAADHAMIGTHKRLDFVLPPHADFPAGPYGCSVSVWHGGSVSLACAGDR